MFPYPLDSAPEQPARTHLHAAQPPSASAPATPAAPRTRWQALALGLVLAGVLAACSDKTAPAASKTAPAPVKVGVITVQS